MKKIFKKNGQSLIEVIVAMTIFSLMAVSMISLLLGSLSLLTEGGKISQANMLAQEGIEIVRAIKTRAWNEFVYDKTAVEKNVNNWKFVGEGTTEQIGGFSRKISFFSVYRNAQNEIIDSLESGAFLDKETKEVEVEVSWNTGRGGVNSVKKNTYFTNWDSFDFVQSDWSSGDGQDIFGGYNAYDFGDGFLEAEISGTLTLKEVATSTFATQGYIVSSAYNVGENKAFGVLLVDAEIPESCSSCDVMVQLQSASDQGGVPGIWSATWAGPEGDDGDESDYYTATSSGTLIHFDHNNYEWLRYKVILLGEVDSTPVVNEIKINHKN